MGIDFLLKGMPLAPQSEVLLAMWLVSRMLVRLLEVLQVNYLTSWILFVLLFGRYLYFPTIFLKSCHYFSNFVIVFHFDVAGALGGAAAGANVGNNVGNGLNNLVHGLGGKWNNNYGYSNGYYNNGYYSGHGYGHHGYGHHGR